MMEIVFMEKVELECLYGKTLPIRLISHEALLCCMLLMNWLYKVNNLIHRELRWVCTLYLSSCIFGMKGSVWSALPPVNTLSSESSKHIILAVASMDSASFFRDKSLGADSPISVS